MTIDDVIPYLNVEFLEAAFDVFNTKTKSAPDVDYIYSSILPQEYSTLAMGIDYIIASTPTNVYGITWELIDDNYEIRYWVTRPLSLIQYVESLLNDEVESVKSKDLTLRDFNEINYDTKKVLFRDYIRNEFLRQAHDLYKALHKYNFLLIGKISKKFKIGKTIKKMQFYNAISDTQINMFGDISQYLNTEVLGVYDFHYPKYGYNFKEIELKDTDEKILWMPERFGSSLPKIYIKKADNTIERLKGKGIIPIEGYNGK